MSEKDAETVTSEDIVRACLVRLRDDRQADPGELREYMALSGLEAFDDLIRELTLEKQRGEAYRAALERIMAGGNFDVIGIAREALRISQGQDE